MLILGSHYLALISAKCTHPIMSLPHAAPLPPQCWHGFVFQLAKPFGWGWDVAALNGFTCNICYSVLIK